MFNARPSRVCSFAVLAAAHLAVGAGAPAAESRAPDRDGLGGGGGDPPRDALSPCISPAERAAAEIESRANTARFGRRTLGIPGVPAYRFWPQAGTLGCDLFTTNFVDIHPAAGMLDYACDTWVYDGHNGHDIDLRSFAEQIVGVPIFAVDDGTVVARADGNFDMNTTWNNQPANYVILDHGGGHQTWYWHMKRNSVAVALGQTVRAGQQIGLTASSGVSTGPHLHFETRLNGAAYEPFAGACRAGASGWVSQPQIDRTTMYLRDFGITNQSLSSFLGWPRPYPRTTHFSFSDTTSYYWLQGHNLPAGSTYQFKFYRPDATLAYQSPVSGIGFSTQFYRWYWAWFSWNVAEMRSIAGTWHVQVFFNGQLMIDAPVEVKAERDPAFNRPPDAVTAAFDPTAPANSDVIFCRVGTSLTLDDPDFNVVRYRYLWRVNGLVVRDVVSAGHSDAVPRNSVPGGGRLVCEVTPHDGLLDGPTAIASLTVGCLADFNGDGSRTVPDLFDFLAEWFSAGLFADVNGSGAATVQDIFDYLAAFIAGCG